MNDLYRALTVLVIALFLIAALPAIAQEAEETPRTGLRPDAPPYAVRGPYPVGTMEFVIEDEERPLPVTVWYPALNPGAAEEVTTYTLGLGDVAPPEFDTLEGRALRDAAPDHDSGPYPLVVNSHGLGGSRVVQAYMLEHIASYGFVVMAPEHPGTAMLDAFTATEEQFEADNIVSLFCRPSDMRRVIEFADTLNTTVSALEGTIDTELVGVMGWSTGGTTALSAAGAQIDFAALGTWCAEHGTEWWAAEACQFQGHEDQLAELYGADTPTGLLPTISDPRVDALVAHAPGGEVPVFGADGMAMISVPTLVIYGSKDSFIDHTYNAWWAYEHISSPQKSLVVLQNGDHLLFGKCPGALVSLAFELCSDPVWDMDRAHDLVNHFTTAFLLSVLKDDADAAAALAPEAVQFPGITYETTMGQ